MFGLKSLRDLVYIKACSRVDHENWHKEIAGFVASPLKRTTSTSSTTSYRSTDQHQQHPRTKPWAAKQFASPAYSFSSKLSSRSSHTSSVTSLDDLEDPQMDQLRGKVAKLEEENSKLTGAETDRRKLELEVNY